MKINGTTPTIAPNVERHVSYLGVSENPAAFGAATAQASGQRASALEHAGDKVFAAGLIQQGFYNETVAKEADVQASNDLMNLQFDPRNGYMSKKGKTAIDSYADTQQAARDIRTKYLDSMPNDQAKKMFDQVFLRRLQYAQEGIGSHASHENLRWMKDTSLARESGLVSEGALNWNNLKRFNEVTIPAIAAEVSSRGELEGEPANSELTRQKVQQAIDAAHVTRLKAMIPYDPVGALTQLVDVGKQLSAQGKIHAEEAVMHGVRLAHEQNVWQEHADLKARQANDEKIGQDFFTRLKNGQLNYNAIDQSTLSTPQKVHWFTLLNTQTRQADRLENNNPTIVADMLKRITLPYGDPRKIVDINDVFAKVGQGISIGAAGTLVKLVTDQRTASGQKLAEVRNRAFADFRPQFVHDTATGPDYQGGKDFFEFQQAVIAKEEEIQQKDKGNPYDVYTPGNKNYIGNMVDTYKATFRMRINRAIDAIRGPEAQGKITTVPLNDNQKRKSGESVKDFLKRTNGQ